MKLPPWMEAWTKSADNPLLFVTGVLGGNPYPWQRETLEALPTHDRLAIRSGHGVGKTTLECWIALWFILTRFPCKIPITANSQDQLRDVVWAELAKWFRCLPKEAQEQFDLGADRLSLKGAPEQSFAVARTASRDKPEALQGFHSENLLFLVEEASGIPDIVFQVAQGSMSTPGSVILMAGNATRNQGYFHRAFHDLRDRWWTKKVSSEDVPTARGHIEEIANAYGTDSNVYRVRVLGEFPTSDDNTVVPLESIEAAMLRQVDHYGKYIWGLDVARFGDDRTVLIKRRQNALPRKPMIWRNKDTMQVAGLVKLEYDETRLEDRPTAIMVDVIGLGSGVVDRLKEDGLPVKGINVAEAAPIKERYSRLRDELWFRARDWFADQSCVVVRDDELTAELSTVKYSILPTGKVKVESKDEMKKRGLRSPDIADAFVLTFAPGSKYPAGSMPTILYPKDHISNKVM